LIIKGLFICLISVQAEHHPSSLPCFPHKPDLSLYHFITTLELYAREFGAGAPLLILHGLFGFSDNWQTIAKALSDQHLVVTPDLRNHGRSPHLSTHSYPEMADDLRFFLEQRWMFSADVIGHSMGGKAAMQFALEYPDMVHRLVVVDIEPFQADDNQSDIFRALLDMDLSKMANRQDAESYLSDRITDFGTRQFLLKNITREEDGRFTWKMNLPVLWKHYANILAPVKSPKGNTFDKPTLFVRGSRSDYIKDAEIPLIKTLFPRAEVVTIEGAGHWVHADKPQELLAVLRAFLD
jgi:esterase